MDLGGDYCAEYTSSNVNRRPKSAEDNKRTKRTTKEQQKNKKDNKRTKRTTKEQKNKKAKEAKSMQA